MYTTTLEMRWHLFQKLSVSVGFGFEHGTQVLVGQETFDRLGHTLQWGVQSRPRCQAP